MHKGAWPRLSIETRGGIPPPTHELHATSPSASKSDMNPGWVGGTATDRQTERARTRPPPSLLASVPNLSVQRLSMRPRMKRIRVFSVLLLFDAMFAPRLSELSLPFPRPRFSSRGALIVVFRSPAGGKVQPLFGTCHLRRKLLRRQERFVRWHSLLVESLT